MEWLSEFVQIIQLRNVGDSELGHAIETLSSHGLTPMGHVTRDDRQFCVAMERVDVGDGSRKPGMRVQTIELQTAGNEVGVGNVNELHVNGTAALVIRTNKRSRTAQA